MSEHEQRPGEPEPDGEETISDLDVPAEKADDVAGGTGRLKWGDIELKNG